MKTRTRKTARQNSRAKHPQEFIALRRAVECLSELRPRRLPQNAQVEQPFDSVLLSISPLYRRSRENYLSSGGKFRSLLVSSPRTLSSPTLVEPLIQYSPIETEMIWAATDRAERKNSTHLLTLRTYVGSLFHEQNHRFLWTMLPPAPSDKVGIRRYLNFAESLVIATDMALGDQLGPKLAGQFYLTGTIYDPGTDIGRLKLSRREYRNYLQAATHSTYLNLEFYDPEQVGRGVAALFPNLQELALRAARRAGNLDRSFVWKTNPAWQKKHRDKVVGKLSRGFSGRGSSSKGARRNEALQLPDNPMDNRMQYLLAERWFEALGL